MKVDVYNLEGKVSGSVELNDEVFGIEIKETVVHQVYKAQLANARQPWAHTKDKSEVRGGGRKPWKQKGTGRARHGSIRSPLWRGGGVTFGPTSEINFSQKINRKTSNQAVKMCLADKVKSNQFLVLENFDLSGKTSQMVKLRNVLPGAGKTTIVLSESPNEKLNLSTRNIPKLNLQRAVDTNVVDLMHHQYVVTTKNGLKVLESRLAVKSK